MVLNLIGLFGGFLVSSIIDSTLGEFSEWAVVGAALVIATLESFSNFFYYVTNQRRGLLRKNYSLIRILYTLNFFKIGVIYGLVVDAFKLGS